MHELTLDEEEDNTVEKGSRGLDRSSTDSRVASKYSGVTLSLSLPFSLFLCICVPSPSTRRTSFSVPNASTYVHREVGIGLAGSLRSAGRM